MVSIQLISPASGDSTLFEIENQRKARFHSINIPSEWGWLFPPNKRWRLGSSFHSINIPSEWGYHRKHGMGAR